MISSKIPSMRSPESSENTIDSRHIQTLIVGMIRVYLSKLFSNTHKANNEQ